MRQPPITLDQRTASVTSAYIRLASYTGPHPAELLPIRRNSDKVRLAGVQWNLQRVRLLGLEKGQLLREHLRGSAAGDIMLGAAGNSAMPATPAREITELLLAWSRDEEEALDRLVPIVHQELHRLAHRYMRHERADHTLQSTALVHEAYQRLIDSRNVRWQNRAHFFAIAAQSMRRILVDFARSRQYLKRGGQYRQVSLGEALMFSANRGADFVALDDALRSLNATDPRKSQVVELRFFGGLTVNETAEVLKVSPETVMRDWRLAKAWLLRELSGASR
jgi:RNA polymerase sigma factor (TIGR02999 family)